MLWICWRNLFEPAFSPKPSIGSRAALGAKPPADQIFERDGAGQIDHRAGLFVDDFFNSVVNLMDLAGIFRHFGLEDQPAIPPMAVQSPGYLLARLNPDAIAGLEPECLARRSRLCAVKAADLLQSQTPANPIEDQSPQDLKQPDRRNFPVADLGNEWGQIPVANASGRLSQGRRLAKVSAAVANRQAAQSSIRGLVALCVVCPGDEFPVDGLQPRFLPEEETIALASVVGGPVTPEMLEEDGLLQPPPAQALDAGHIGATTDAGDLSAMRGHFRHERDAVERAAAVERVGYLSRGPNPDELAPHQTRRFNGRGARLSKRRGRRRTCGFHYKQAVHGCWQENRPLVEVRWPHRNFEIRRDHGRQHICERVAKEEMRRGLILARSPRSLRRGPQRPVAGIPASTMVRR